jgi:cation:H+ antiporter
VSAAWLDALVLAATAGVALAASAVLVRRLESLASAWRLTEAMLGVLVALAADAPEISSAVTAMARGQTTFGAGVVLGSNLFNLAVLLGVSAVVAGGIALHRRVAVLEGVPAVWIALVALGVTAATLGATLGLALVLLAVVPYLVVAAGGVAGGRGAGAARRARRWLHAAVDEASAELATGIRPAAAGRADRSVALGALVLVVAASVVMEHAATSLGARTGVSSLVMGAVVLAAVTSLPNAVGALYLARRGRGAAVLSEATNSNMLNVLVGLLVPAVVLSASAASADAQFVASWCVAMTVGCLALAAWGRGVSRRAGLVVVAAYVGFVAATVAR